MLIAQNRVLIKEIISVQYKEALLEKHNAALLQIEESISALERDGKQFLRESEGKDPVQAEAFRVKLMRQLDRQKDIRNKLIEKISGIEQLEPDQVNVRKMTISGVVNIQVGDNLDEKLTPSEIVLKDGVVIEIRSINDRK